MMILIIFLLIGGDIDNIQVSYFQHFCPTYLPKYNYFAFRVSVFPSSYSIAINPEKELKIECIYSNLVPVSHRGRPVLQRLG